MDPHRSLAYRACLFDRCHRAMEDAIGGVVAETRRETPIRGEYDVVVLGGGPAGIAAAVAAARKGNSTLLVERYGFLGGAGTMSGLSNFCGLHAKIDGLEHRQIVHGVVDDLLARLRRFEGLAAVHPAYGGKIMAQAYDTAAFKLAADDLLQSAEVKILFHALAVGVAMRSDTIIDALLIEFEIRPGGHSRSRLHRLLGRCRRRPLGGCAVRTVEPTG